MAFDKMFGIGIVVSAVDRVTAPMRNIRASMGATQKSAQAVGSAMLKVGAGMTVAGAVMAGISYKLAKSTMDIEDAAMAFRTVATPIEGSVVKAYDLAIERAIAFSQQNRQTATEYLQAAYQMGSAGLETLPALMATEWGLKVSTATMADAVEATQLLGVTYLNLGDRSADVGTEMNRLADMLTKTQQAFLFPTLQPLVEGMKYATPAAKAYRVSLEQTLPIMGMLNTAGLTGTLAGTAFKATLDKLGNASRKFGISLRYTAEGNLDLIGFLEDLRAKFGDLSKAPMAVQEQMAKGFGRLGKTMIQLLSGQEAALRTYEVAMVNSGGITEETAALMESTFSALTQQMKNSFKAITYQLGVTVVPIMKSVTEAIKSIGISISDWIRAHPSAVKLAMTIMSIGGATLAVLGILTMLGGAVLLLVPAFVAGAGAIGGFLAVTVPVILGLTALAGAVWMVITNWSGLVHVFRVGWNAIVSGFSGSINYVVDLFTGFLTFLFELPFKAVEAGKKLVLSYYEGIKSVAMMPVNAVEEMATNIRSFFHASEPKRGPLRGMEKSGEMAMSKYSTGILGGAVKAVDALGSVVNAIFDPSYWPRRAARDYMETARHLLPRIEAYTALGMPVMGSFPATAGGSAIPALPGGGGVGGTAVGGAGAGADYGFGGGGGATVINNSYTVHVENGVVILSDGEEGSSVVDYDFDERLRNLLDSVLRR